MNEKINATMESRLNFFVSDWINDDEPSDSENLSLSLTTLAYRNQQLKNTLNEILDHMNQQKIKTLTFSTLIKNRDTSKSHKHIIKLINTKDAENNPLLEASINDNEFMLGKPNFNFSTKYNPKSEHINNILDSSKLTKDITEKSKDYYQSMSLLPRIYQCLRDDDHSSIKVEFQDGKTVLIKSKSEKDENKNLLEKIRILYYRL